MKQNTISYIIRQLFSSEGRLSNTLKYTVLQNGCVAVHFLLIFVFLLLDVIPMVVFNIFSTICYIACGSLVRNGKYITFYYITFAEICLHSYIASILLGWNSGFPLYIIGIMPVIFYMHFSLDVSSTIKDTFLIGICGFLTFITCKLISYNIEPFYHITEKNALVLYIFNSLCTYTILLFFSMVFLKEMQSSHAVLEDENAQLGRIAGTDTLTGLLNRHSMNRIMESTISSGVPFSLMMCDIDDFKKINDTYGHNNGDEILKAVSDIITDNMNERDYVCRWGGEEIMILTVGMPLSAAASAAERIRHDISEIEIITGGDSIGCTITIGVAENTEADTISEIISLADKRLYKGKNSGKNCVVAYN
ncbi:MAG: GGDEF domain-containing protein [Oscillospiraceae bacterium]|nr:GGDEF domain-containing protein [Oscillospiraceae bacterium]